MAVTDGFRRVRGLGSTECIGVGARTIPGQTATAVLDEAAVIGPGGDIDEQRFSSRFWGTA